MKLYLKTYSRDLNHQRRTQVYQMDGRHNLTTSKRIAEAIVKRENNSLSGGFVTAYQLVRDGEVEYLHTYAHPWQRKLPLETPAEEYLAAKAKRDPEEIPTYCERTRRRRELLELLNGAAFTVTLQSTGTKAPTDTIECSTLNINITLTETDHD